MSENNWYWKVVKTWQNYISKEYDAKTMRSVLYDIVDRNDVNPKFVSYAIKCGGIGGWLHYPQGLYSAIKDKEVLHGWNQLIFDQVRRRTQRQANKAIAPPETYRQPIERKETARERKNREFETLFK